MGGPGSGWNRKTPAQHRAAGTYRADRHSRPSTTLPAEFRDDALTIVRRLLALGNRYLTAAEKKRGKGAMSIGPALKCLHAALSIARGLGDADQAPTSNRLNEHLARRPEVVRLPTAKGGERQ